MTHTIILIISSLLLVSGILAAFIPGIPNLIFMLCVALVFGIYDDFIHLTLSNLTVLVIISVIAMLIDFISGIIGAKWGGASWKSVAYGVVGLVFGTLFIPIPIIGSLIGMFFGILFSEYYRTKDLHVANKAALGSFFGFLAGTGVRVVASVAFLILFIVFAVK